MTVYANGRVTQWRRRNWERGKDTLRNLIPRSQAPVDILLAASKPSKEKIQTPFRTSMASSMKSLPLQKSITLRIHCLRCMYLRCFFEYCIVKYPFNPQSTSTTKMLRDDFKSHDTPQTFEEGLSARHAHCTPSPHELIEPIIAFCTMSRRDPACSVVTAYLSEQERCMGQLVRRVKESLRAMWRLDAREILQSFVR